MLVLFINTLTAGDKYSRHNTENFPKEVQMQLSQIPETFCGFLFAFLNSKSNFEYFEKNIILIA